MNNLLTILGLAGPISLIVALLVIALLSQRLGAVTKRPPHYRWFYVAMGLIGVSILSRLLALGQAVDDSQRTALVESVPLAAAVTISVLVVWRYWGWLLNEQTTQADPGSKTSASRGNPS